MIVYQLVAGDTLSYLQDPPTGAAGAYSPADGWTLKYRLLPRDGAASVIDLTATQEGTVYRIASPASVTSGWAAGHYSVAAWVEKGTEKYTVSPVFQQMQILADPRTAAAGYDGRTQAQKALDDLYEARATHASSNGNVAAYSIAGRSMQFRTTDEIDKEIRFWSRERAKEIRRETIAKGNPDPRFAYTRFNGHGT